MVDYRFPHRKSAGYFKIAGFDTVEKLQLPYICHIFVCTNDRNGERKSCADNEGAQLRLLLKNAVEKRGWKSKIRVSQSGCLGQCGRGPNVMCYPQGIWFSQVTIHDIENIMQSIEDIFARLE